MTENGHRLFGRWRLVRADASLTFAPDVSMEFLQGGRLKATREESERLLHGKPPVFAPWARADFHEFDGTRRLYAFRQPWLARWKSRSRSGGRVMSCNMSFWRDDLLRVNGFDERMEGYGAEDRELAARLENAGVKRRAENSVWKPVWGKRAVVPDRYREAAIDLGSYQIKARAYDEGVAFRYVFPGAKPLDQLLHGDSVSPFTQGHQLDFVNVLFIRPEPGDPFSHVRSRAAVREHDCRLL